MSRRNLYWLLGVVAVSLLGFAVSYSSPTRERNENYELVRLMVEVMQEVEQKYVIDLNSERKRKLAEDMINGGLERLDPHSQYINPQEYRQFTKQSRGKFGGIGIEIGLDRQNRGQLMVVSPMPGTPAMRAGILANDLIVKIDGKSTENMRLKEAVELIQGDPGQKVTLTVLHDGSREPVDVEIVRDEIHIQSVKGDHRKESNLEEWDFLYDKKSQIGYIRLTNFSETATREIKSALEELQKQGARGLIFDLRNNPGGLLRVAVEISNLFLKEGRIVSTKGRNHKDESYDARPEQAMPYFADHFPIAILVNKFSASASEIVAAALQDNGRATIVGERSYGKGSVQNIIMMERDTSALKLTTASYWRPSGKNIHRFPESKDKDDWGVKPNEGFEVAMKDEERMEYLVWRSDRDIVRHQNADSDVPTPPQKKEKKESKEKADKAKESKEAKEKKEFKDRVLERALEHLRKEVEKQRAADRLPLEKGDA